MATEDKDIHQMVSQLNQTLSLTDQNLDQVSEDRSTKVLNILAGAAAELKANQEDLKEDFYELLAPFYQSGEGNSRNFDLSQLQDEVLRVIGTKGENELVGLAEGLEGLKKRGDELNERVIELMTDYNIVPKCSGIEESSKENKTTDLGSLAFTEEDGQETSEGLKKKLESGEFSLYDVTIQLYGFPWDVAMEIETSLGYRRLVKSERLFLEDEGQIMLDDDGELQEKDAGELKWVRVKKLKQKFEELKKKIYIKEELDLNVSPKASDSGNEAEETIFQDLQSKLKHMMEIYFGMVPISVYKIIYMMENPEGLKLDGLVMRMATVFGSDTERLYEKLKLNDRMDQAHKIILLLRSVLVTAGLSYTRMIKEGESALYEKLLSESEEELREFQRNIDWVKSELKFI
ncbi:hypothetical protein QQP08_027276 [Theobroma cacao]|nr:hypothetical protein QQP08_026481 [Theobroma cacao]WRX34789.1 hypothetical protein QQP08_027276 [Theobroma cacao]